jgi:hypothetical protein
MSLIATAIEPNGVARIFFNCRAAEPDPRDEARIARAIERAVATTPDGDARQLPKAA